MTDFNPNAAGYMATKNTKNTKMPDPDATAAATGLVFVFLVFFVANLSGELGFL